MSNLKVKCKCGRTFNNEREWREHEMILRPSQSLAFQKKFPKEMPHHKESHFIVK